LKEKNLARAEHYLNGLRKTPLHLVKQSRQGNIFNLPHAREPLSHGIFAGILWALLVQAMRHET